MLFFLYKGTVIHLGLARTEVCILAADNDPAPQESSATRNVLAFPSAAGRMDAEFGATGQSDWTRAVDEARWLFEQDPARPPVGFARRAAAFAVASAKLERTRPEAVGDMLRFDHGVSIQFAAMTHLIDARLDAANRPAPSTPVLAA